KERKPPLLAWAEPDPVSADLSNNTGRRSNFVPFVVGSPTWPDDLLLLEARLFWENAAIHIVAEKGGGCSWVTLEEKNSGDSVVRRELPVLTIRDRKRGFGL